MAELIALKDPEEIKSLYETFKKRMTPVQEGEKITTKINYRAGSPTVNLFWRPNLNPDLSIWCYFDDHDWGGDSYYGCVFGIGKPKENGSNNITVEINYNKKNPTKQPLGRFLKDKKNNFYIGHTGQFGGNYKGVSKKEFLDYHGVENLQSIEWINGTTDDVIIIGKIDDESFPDKIAEYINAVYNFKKNRANQNRDSNSPHDKNEDLTYKPEPPHKPYDQKGGTIIPLKFHPNVVDSLKKDLEKIGYQSFNTQAIDLFIPSNGEKVGVLFEVKTGIEKTSIYTAIGQLMYREACKGKPLKKIIVIPEPEKEMKRILTSLNIGVLIYTFDKDKKEADFYELEKMFERK